MTQTPDSSTSRKAMVAKCTMEPTEMGIRLTIANRAAIVTCEFDVEEPPEVLLGMLAAAPEIVQRMMADIANDETEAGD